MYGDYEYKAMGNKITVKNGAFRKLFNFPPNSSGAAYCQYNVLNCIDD